MRACMIFMTVLLCNVFAHADVFEKDVFTNITSGAKAYREFDGFRAEYSRQPCTKKGCALQRTHDTYYIETDSSPTIVGFTVQESYTKKIDARTFRRCLSEIHTNDLSKPAKVTFDCQTEHF